MQLIVHNVESNTQKLFMSQKRKLLISAQKCYVSIDVTLF
jgi:hypothetical protein